MKNLRLQLVLAIFIIGINISFSQTWVQQSSGTNLNLYCVEFFDVSTGFVGADSGRILKTTNSGVNWTTINTSINFNIISLKFISPLLGYAAGDKIIKTTNGGVNWSILLDTAFITDIYFWNSNNWFLTSSFPHTNKKTSDGGITWINMGSTDVLHMCIYFPDPNTGWMASRGVTGSFVGQHLDKTTNGGFNWTTQYSGILLNGNGWFYDIFFNNLNTGFGVCSETGGSKILVTTNGGSNWISSIVQYAQRDIYSSGILTWTCGFNGSIMKSLYIGSTWATEQVPNTSVILNSIYFIDNQTGWTCGSSGFIYKTTNGGITGLNPSNNNAPSEYSLSQNYPNPFNPTTQIAFDIPKSSFVKLVVYDQLGREIEHLVNEELNPGGYKYEWNATQYPSGIYLYKLHAGEYSETKKMVLIK